MTGAIKIDIVFYPPLQRRNGCIPENSKRFVQEREDSPGEFFNFRLILLNARNSLAGWMAAGFAALLVAWRNSVSRILSFTPGERVRVLAVNFTLSNRCLATSAAA